MANTLQVKRSAVASKVPLTTDLALGELAINTYDGLIFTKKNNGSDAIVTFKPLTKANIEADLTGVISSHSHAVAADSVTNAGLANMAVNTIKGRVTAGTGDPEDLTATQVRTIINVEDGAQKNSNILKSEIEAVLTGTITTHDHSSISGNAATATKVQATATGVNTVELVRGNMADTDFFRILVGGTAADAGYAEIATADNANEPIYVRQYTGTFATLTRTATLLDASGNTSFPGSVTATSFSGSGAALTSLNASSIGSGTVPIGNLPTGTAGTNVALGNHVHGNITSSGAIGSTSGLPIITTTSGVLTAGSFGTASGTFCQGNDSRLSDARTPTSHTHGNIANGGTIGSTSGLPIITGTSGILQAGSFGTTSGTFCQGNDARLSDARTPLSHVHGNITNAGAIGSTANLPVITTTSGVLTTGSFGTAANTFCQGNDARLSDARTPTAHNHAATEITSGTLSDSVLPTRLGTAAKLITDWNAATETGFYRGNSATNAPASGWYVGEVHVHDSNYIVQTIYNFYNSTTSDTMCYRRRKFNGSWESWFRLRISQEEQALLWAGINHTQAWSTITGTPTTIAGYGITDAASTTLTTYTTTTATSEGWYRLATVPIATTIKRVLFHCKAYTATGTTSEATVEANVAYYSGSTASSNATISAFSAHTFDSRTNAENGWVFCYFRVSFDANYAYLDIYKYKATAVTIESTPYITNSWTWNTGVLTVNPTVGSLDSQQCDTYIGLCANANRASYASGAGYATYSNYGTYGGYTLSNTTDNSGKWAYYGEVYLAYNASYMNGHSINTVIRLEEASPGGVTASNLDEIYVHIAASLAPHANTTEFNSAVPNIDLRISGSHSLTNNDFAALVYSTSTSTKYIRLYIKLKAANTQYIINPLGRYGFSYSGTNAVATGYCYLNYQSSQAVIAALPAPAQGSVVYGSRYVGIIKSDVEAVLTGEISSHSHAGSGGITTGKAIAMAMVFG